MIFIDSNIWCYYFNENAKEHPKVSSFIDKILGKQEMAMNNIILMEVAHYLIKNLGAIIGKEKMEKMMAFPFIIDDFNYDQLLESINLLAKYTQIGIGGRDATILATVKKLSIKQILTHDNAFKKIDFIEVIDPIDTD